MRALVEQTADAVRAWFAKLAAETDDAGRLPRPEDVHVLMGGVDADGWLDEPERPAVLVGTQDMLLSRALMRGYASSRALWPMEFALLHEDAQWVFDEVQLMGAGRATSAQLEAFRRSEADRARRDGRAAGAVSRSLWISATLDPGWLATVDHPAPPSAAVVRVDPAAAPDGRLARLAQAAKRLARSPVAPASPKKPDLADYVARLADAILDAHRGGRMTLAIVNRVARAQALRDILDKKLSRRPAAPTLALVHSRFRPADRAREMEKVIGADELNPHGRIVIATQAVEAGLDISAAVLFHRAGSLVLAGPAFRPRQPLRGASGFTGDPKHVPEPISGSPAPSGASATADRADAPAPRDAEGHDEDPLSGNEALVPLADHLRNVAAEAESLCPALDVEPAARATIGRAARWHDLGKAHEVFQDTKQTRHGRTWFRHELASALAFLAHEDWSRDADLTAYLIAAHHGKVRMNLRALPREAAPKEGRAGARFARGVWEGDELPPFDLEGGERWAGGSLLLSIMELGWDDVSRESWTERTREQLARLGPFRLAWLETLLRVADWRASAKERKGGCYDAR